MDAVATAAPAAAVPLSIRDLHDGAKHQRGRNALHQALTNNDTAGVAGLIESGDAVLLNQQTSNGGVTPLMLLAMGHCDESLIWRLLELGGASSVAMRSWTRRTAADYAEEARGRDGRGGRSAELVQRLRALEEVMVRRTAQYRCPECGDVVQRRPLLAFFWERASKGEEPNDLLKSFFSSDCYRPLLQPLYHQINHTRQIRKELSESLAVLRALERQVPAFGGSWHLIDLCCGRSVTAALASLRFPGLEISAVDWVEPRYLPHFNAVDGCGVHYVQLDVLGKDFMPELERLLVSSARPAALLGMHLCGNLSLRAAEAFGRMPLVHSVVLSPCCLPRKKDADAPAHIFATKDSDEQYVRWGSHLESALREVAPSSLVSSYHDADILSPKNLVICGTKPAELGTSSTSDDGMSVDVDDRSDAYTVVMQNGV